MWRELVEKFLLAVLLLALALPLFACLFKPTADSAPAALDERACIFEAV